MIGKKENPFVQLVVGINNSMGQRFSVNKYFIDLPS
jgi:hypothetical protein